MLQLKLAKHMVQLPQIHLDACSAADFRRYTSVLENDVPCISKNIDALFVGLAALAQVPRARAFPACTHTTTQQECRTMLEADHLASICYVLTVRVTFRIGRG